MLTDETSPQRSNRSTSDTGSNADASWKVAEHPNGHGTAKRHHLGPRVFDWKKSYAVVGDWMFDGSTGSEMTRVGCSGLPHLARTN